MNQIYKKVAPESEDGNSQGNTLATYNYGYDNRGNLIEVTKGTNKVVESYVYDATNRMVEGTRAGGGDSSYIFDGFGHLVGNTAAILMSEDEDGNSQGGGGQGGNGQGDEDEDEDEDGDGNGNDGNKTWFVNISKDYVIDYTSPLAHVILETESDSFDLVYQHVYGLAKLSTVIYGATACDEDGDCQGCGNQDCDGQGQSNLIQYRYENSNGDIVLSTTDPGVNVASDIIIKVWHHQDRLGSTVFLTSNISGKAVSQAAYDAWGKPLKRSLICMDDRTIDLVTAYTGHMWDDVLAVFYARARMYDAADRRFMTVDLIKGDILNPQSIILYVYCLDNPLRWVDPLGLSVKERYDNELKNKLTDPYRSVYLEAGLRESAISLLHNQMYTNGRNGTIELNLLQPKTSREDGAVLGAVRKLLGLHGEPEYDDYLYNRLQNIAMLNNYNATQPYVINEQVLSYIVKFSCDFQRKVDEERAINPTKWSERTLIGQRVTADLIRELNLLALAYLSSAPKSSNPGSAGSRNFTSTDKYVGETANAIEARNPNSVVGVNRIVKDSTGRIITEYDIELTNYVIQVKSGSAKGLTTQMINTAASTNKTVIGYTPDLNPSSAVVKGVKSAGFDIFTNLRDLLSFLGI